MSTATVIIASWNAESTVRKAIDSALAQSGVSIDVIVADDASSDRTADVVENIPNVTYTRLASNGGPSAARNAALALCETDWVAVLDSDDTMTVNRISKMIQLAENAKADIVLGNIQRVEEDGTPIDQAHFLKDVTFDPIVPLKLTDYLKHNVFEDGSPDLGYLKPLFRMKTMRRLGLNYDEGLRNSEDFHIILRALALGANVIVSPDPDYLYTVRRGSISYTVNPNHFKNLIKADARFVEEFADILDAETQELFQARRKMTRHIMEGEIVMRALKSKDVKTAASRLWRNPATSFRVMHQLVESALKRLGGRP